MTISLSAKMAKEAANMFSSAASVQVITQILRYHDKIGPLRQSKGKLKPVLDAVKDYAYTSFIPLERANQMWKVYQWFEEWSAALFLSRNYSLQEVTDMRSLIAIVLTVWLDRSTV